MLEKLKRLFTAVNFIFAGLDAAFDPQKHLQTARPALKFAQSKGIPIPEEPWLLRLSRLSGLGTALIACLFAFSRNYSHYGRLLFLCNIPITLLNLGKFAPADQGLPRPSLNPNLTAADTQTLSPSETTFVKADSANSIETNIKKADTAKATATQTEDKSASEDIILDTNVLAQGVAKAKYLLKFFSTPSKASKPRSAASS